MNTIKITPEQLQHVSSQVDQARQQLESMRGNLIRQIMFVQTMWMGATQERFYFEFERSNPILEKALESMVKMSTELREIATRFQEADAEQINLAGGFGAAGAIVATMGKNDSSLEDKGYRMAYNSALHAWLPVNDKGVTDQAALQAYQKDKGNLDVQGMQSAGNTETPGEDIYAMQIKAYESGIHPFSGEPVSDSLAQYMVVSLKLGQVFMAVQGIRSGIPGSKGPYRLPANHPVTAKIQKNIDAAKERTNIQSRGQNGPEWSSKPEANGQYSGKLLKVPKEDEAADMLAQKIGGESRVKFSNDPKGREFDTVSDQYIAQTKPPLNNTDKQFRNQAKATIEAAIETGRTAYFHFEGEPNERVLRQLKDYSKRYQVDIIIDTTPLKP